MVIGFKNMGIQLFGNYTIILLYRILKFVKTV